MSKHDILDALRHEVRVYPTHIEVSNYSLHEDEELELKFSRKDKPTHSLQPIGYYYDADTRILYLPAGADIEYLEFRFHAKATEMLSKYKVKKMTSGKMVVAPRSDVQNEAVDFLIQRNNYQNTFQFTQLGLNLPTSVGKTYCAIHALVSTHRRALIVCHSNKIKMQWYDHLQDYTDLKADRILLFEGSSTLHQILDGKINPLDYDYFVTLHQTLQSFVSLTNWNTLKEVSEKLQVAVKVIDEAHLYFENSLRLDFFTNIPMTWMITATFGRSDFQQNEIYKMAYKNMLRFGDRIAKEKHTQTFVLLIDSRPSTSQIRYVENATSYGFSSANYATYIEKHPKLYFWVLDWFLNQLEVNELRKQRIEGKRMVIASKIATLNSIACHIQDSFPAWKTSVLTAKDKDRNAEIVEESDCICATSRLVGTGNDYQGLRVLVNFEPMASEINIKQLMGRLRPYIASDGEKRETIFVYIVDCGFPKVEQFFNRVERIIASESKCYCKRDLRPKN